MPKTFADFSPVEQATLVSHFHEALNHQIELWQEIRQIELLLTENDEDMEGIDDYIEGLATGQDDDSTLTKAAIEEAVNTLLAENAAETKFLFDTPINGEIQAQESEVSEDAV